MLQQHQRAKVLSEQSSNILSVTWKKNIKSKYKGAIKRHTSFCQKREADTYNSNDTIVIELLTQESHHSNKKDKQTGQYRHKVIQKGGVQLIYTSH